MNILLCCQQFYPSVGGVQLVMERLAVGLIELGHQVTVATSTHPDRHQRIYKGIEIESFDIQGGKVKGYKATTYEIKRFQSLVLNPNFDLVFTYAAQQWSFDLLLPILGNSKAKLVAAPCGYSQLHHPAFEAYFSELSEYLRKFDACVYHSNTTQDYLFGQKNGLTNAVVIPNGADDEFAAPIKDDVLSQFGIEKSRPILLSVGSHTGQKGHEESIAIASGFSTPVTLIINGNGQGGCSRSCQLKSWATRINPRLSIRCLDLPRNELIELYKQADLMLFPSNLECAPVVLYEAMAAGLPFASTPVGNVKEIVTYSKAGVLLPVDFTKSNNTLTYADVSKSILLVNSLIEDHDKLRQMRKSGQRYWKNHHRWHTIIELYQQLFRQL